VQLTLIAQWPCKEKNCPKIFLSEDGQTVVVQGYDFRQLDTPAGESAVMIPRSVFDAAVRNGGA
jgi:hypothetical protein